MTVDDALNAYEKHLEAQGRDPYNAKRPRIYLSQQLLAMPVKVLGDSGHKQLATWRDNLVAEHGLSPAAANRTRICLRAALNLAAETDPIQIPHTRGWNVGLVGLPDATEARRVVMPDIDVGRLVSAPATPGSPGPCRDPSTVGVGHRLLRQKPLRARRTAAVGNLPSAGCSV